MGSVGCKSTAVVHFSPSFCPIAGLWGCKFGENCPRWGRFSLSTPQVRQAPRSLRGRRNIGCNARETGLLRYYRLRPGGHPGLVGITTRPSVFAHFASMPSAVQAPRRWVRGCAAFHGCSSTRRCGARLRTSWVSSLRWLSGSAEHFHGRWRGHPGRSTPGCRIWVKIRGRAKWRAFQPDFPPGFPNRSTKEDGHIRRRLSDPAATRLR